MAEGEQPTIPPSEYLTPERNLPDGKQDGSVNKNPQPPSIERRQEYHMIEPGTQFDPQQELDRLKTLSHSERKTAIQEFKQKLVYQQHGYAMVRAQLIRAFRENPDISHQDLSTIQAKYSEKYGFPDQSNSIIDQCITEAKQKHELVQQLYKDNSDPSALCMELMGFEPEGEVIVTPGPITLNFQFNNPLDFARAYYRGGIVTDEKYKEVGANINGFFLLRSGVSDRYDRIVIALNGSRYNAGTYNHEEQHAFHAIFAKVAEPYFNRADAIILRTQIWDEKVEAYVVTFMEQHLSNALVRLKDEFLARKKGIKLSDQDVSTLLLKQGSTYDYLAPVRTKMTARYSTGDFPPQIEKGVKDAIQQILVDRYKSVLEQAFESFNKLQMAGYQDTDIIDLLTPIPLSAWSRAVDRIAPHSRNVLAHNKRRDDNLAVIRRTIAGLGTTEPQELPTRTAMMLKRLKAASEAQSKKTK